MTACLFCDSRPLISSSTYFGHSSKRLRKTFRDAYYALREHIPEPCIAPCDDPLWDAYVRLVGYYERQVRRLRQNRYAALATDNLTDNQRAAVVRTLFGTTNRDAKLLSDVEARMIGQYRTVPANDKAMVRTLLDRLEKMQQLEKDGTQ